MGYVNSHIHTPYSFSAFDSIEQIAKLACEEDVDALGISDFNTTEGYSEFATICTKNGIYPLFGIEFIALSAEDRAQGHRWNDPKNPGVIYFCGKGLRFPLDLSSDSRNLLAALWKGTQDHIWKVISKLNEYTHSTGIDVSFDYNQVRCAFAKNTVRERHVAKAVYLSFVGKWSDPAELLKSFRTLFADPCFEADLADSASMQNEIRNRLLKAGAPAYIEERPEAFLALPDVRNLILEAGGIPCYPVLADDKAGFTDYEGDVRGLADRLLELGIHAVEFIPLRNTFDSLKAYVRHFRDRGFCVTFGTEHNTPEMVPLVPAARNSIPFDDELLKVSYEGACMVAAHQELRSQKRPGFVDESGQKIVGPPQMRDFVRIGDEAIRRAVRKRTS